jgi:hypothetical protein
MRAGVVGKYGKIFRREESDRRIQIGGFPRPPPWHHPGPSRPHQPRCTAHTTGYYPNLFRIFPRIFLGHEGPTAGPEWNGGGGAATAAEAFFPLQG